MQTKGKKKLGFDAVKIYTIKMKGIKYSLLASIHRLYHRNRIVKINGKKLFIFATSNLYASTFVMLVKKIGCSFG